MVESFCSQIEICFYFDWGTNLKPFELHLFSLNWQQKGTDIIPKSTTKRGLWKASNTTTYICFIGEIRFLRTPYICFVKKLNIVICINEGNQIIEDLLALGKHLGGPTKSAFTILSSGRIVTSGPESPLSSADQHLRVDCGLEPGLVEVTIWKEERSGYEA